MGWPQVHADSIGPSGAIKAGRIGHLKKDCVGGSSEAVAQESFDFWRLQYALRFQTRNDCDDGAS